jgi:hypothetical protein
MSHKDMVRYSPIGVRYQSQNTNGNCVPRNCKERIDERNKSVCDQGARFMHSTDTGVPPQPVKSTQGATCGANLLYRAVVAASGEIKPCSREHLLCC